MKVSDLRLKLESIIDVLSVNDVQNDENIELSIFTVTAILKHLQNAMSILNEEFIKKEEIMHLNSEYVETKETEGWDIICECGSPLHISKIRGTIDTIDRDYVCKSCGNRYNEYRLKYPSEHTSYNYSVDGVFTKIN